MVTPRLRARASVRRALAIALLLLAPLSSRADEAPAAEIAAPARIDHAPVPYPAGGQGEAVVALELQVEKDGTVSDVTVRDGRPPFDEAARLAARAWRFSPATRGGIPVRARILARLVFQPPTPPPAAPAPRADLPEAAPAPVEALPVLPPVPPPVEVTVVGEGREELGSTHIPRNETRLIPGAFADPFRVVEIMPGVAPIFSGIPYFTIRGAPPGNVGYSIDGVRVPLLFHVGAGPSVIAPGLVDRVDLFASPYVARFGRHGGGIMAGETTAPSAVARGEAQARVFDAGGMIEQPFAGGRGSVLLAGRYGYTGALVSLVAPDYKLDYWDYQARIAYRLSGRDRLSLFAFGAYDFLRNESVGRTLFNAEFHRLDLRWDHDTDGGHWRVAATLGSDLTLKAQEDSRSPSSNVTSRGARLRFELDQRVARGARLRAGGDVNLDRYDEDREQRGRALRLFPARTDGYGGAWIDLVGRPAAGVELVPGFRFDALHVRGATVLAPEPRLAARLRVIDRVSWISSFGLTHQVPTFVIPVPGSDASIFEATNQEVWQTSQAIEVSLPARLLAKATVFRNLVRLPDGGGRADNYGLELFVRRDFTERLGGFVSYTLSRADREVGGYRTVSSLDRPHVLSVVLGYDLGAGYRLGGRFYLQSGRPYQVLCPTPDCGAADNPFAPAIYASRGRLPAFSRLDVRFEKKWKLDSGAFIAATFEWFNALLAREIDDADWTPRGLVFSGRSPITLPSIGVEAAF